MNLWDARFKKEADQRLNDFNSSISIDHLMVTQDIKGSMAHAAMLAKQGIISKADGAAIAQGLEAIQRDIESGALLIDPSAEDIHMFMEQELTKRIGDAGKRLHTARSRNDQVALDTRMYCSDEVRTVCDKLLMLHHKMMVDKNVGNRLCSHHFQEKTFAPIMGRNRQLTTVIA